MKLNIFTANKIVILLLFISALTMVGCPDNNSGSSNNPTAPSSDNSTDTLTLCQLPTNPNISFTFVPPIGSFQNVKGLVSFTNTPCDTQEFRVAMYIHVPTFQPDFICKPTQANPLTSLNQDGSWEADYTTGGVDETATQIVSFLVKSDFQGQCFTDNLPTIEGKTVLTSVTVNR